MDIPSDSIQLQHQSICMKLNSLDIILSTNRSALPWWELLRGTKALLNDCISHSSLILQYREKLGPTHWILDKILSILLTKSGQAEHLTDVMGKIIRRALAAPHQYDEAEAKHELVELVQKIRTALELEEIIAYQMLDVLKSQPGSSGYTDSTNDVSQKRNLRILN